MPKIRPIGATPLNPHNPNVVLGGSYLNTKLGWNKRAVHKRIKLKPVRTKDLDIIRCMADVKADFEEKVIKLERDGMNSHFIALVAGNYPKSAQRWIVAPHTVEVGQVLKTRVFNPNNKTNGGFPTLTEKQLTQGDAYPLGSIPVGTAVCLIAPATTQDSDFSTVWAREGGSHMFVFKQFPEKYKTFCYYPSFGKTIEFSNRDIAVIGRVSNPGHSTEVRKPKSWKEKAYLGIAHRGKRYSYPDARYARTRPGDPRGRIGLLPKMYAEPIDTTILKGDRNEKIAGPDGVVADYLLKREKEVKEMIKTDALKERESEVLDTIKELGEVDDETMEKMEAMRV